jgi:hypothetical protein
MNCVWQFMWELRVIGAFKMRICLAELLLQQDNSRLSLQRCVDIIYLLRDISLALRCKFHTRRNDEHSVLGTKNGLITLTWGRLGI